MDMRRRRFLHLAAAVAALPVTPRIAVAQAYPTRPITMIVAFPPGGPLDVVGRVLAERMRGPLGQSVIVENVGGAEGNIGTARAARARPDGYTIDLGVMTTHVLNGALYALPYDVLNDFAPIALAVTTSRVLFARKTMPADTVSELIAWLKANPNQATAGFGATGPHLLIVAFRKETGTEFALVPYRGAAPTMQDLVAGQIDLYFGPSEALPLARAGSIKAYAVTSSKRLAVAPNIPTFSELGLPALSHSEWYALFAPKGTPKDIIGRLNAAAVEALADPAVRSRLLEIGTEIFPREQQTPEALGAMVKADAEKWWPIIKANGIRTE